jgi:ADP-heptose:LPS heptosyltransferase
LHPLRKLRRAALGTAAFGLEWIVRLAVLRAPSQLEPPREPSSIFVLRNNDIGDLLVVTPLFEALRRRFPTAHIAAGIGDWNRAVLRGNPHLSEVLPVNAPWFNKYQRGQGTWDRFAYLQRSPEVRELAARRFDIGIDVLGSAWGSLLLLRAGIPWRLGVNGYAGGQAGVQAAVPFDPQVHVGRAALRFAEILGATKLPDIRPQIFLEADEQAQAELAWATAEGRGGKKRRVVVGPSGGLPEKCWPMASYAELVARMEGDLSILILGGLREEGKVAQVAAGSPCAWHLSEMPTLRQVFALLAAADLVLCNSSMLLHTAAAFAKPTLVLLGESFDSARQHQAQWGYPGISRSFGKEPQEREGLYSPSEILTILREDFGAWK